jgi:hypothetical protein
VAGRLRRTLFRNPVETGLVIGLVYLVLTAGIATVAWSGEKGRIDDGRFSSDPLGLSETLTWPIHSWVADPWPGYPGRFDPTVYRSFVDHAWKQTLGAALLEACLIALVIGAVGMALRSVRAGRQP